MDGLARVVEIDGDRLVLELSPYLQSQLYELDPDHEYMVKIEKKEADKTRRQLGLFWSLISEIALEQYGKNQQSVKNEIYGEMLEECQAKFSDVWVIPQGERDLREAFRAVRFLATDGTYNLYRVYYGASKFSTKEMSLLIDTALDWAENVGIPMMKWRDLLDE